MTIHYVMVKYAMTSPSAPVLITNNPNNAIANTGSIATSNLISMVQEPRRVLNEVKSAAIAASPRHCEK